MMSRKVVVFLFALSFGCAGNDTGTDEMRADAGGVLGAGGDAARPDASMASAVWSDAEKCENMCQSYCSHRNVCDGSSIEACRMAIDHADGGTCPERAHLFSSIPQSQVQACINAIEAMSCADFLRMYNTGEGVPATCQGILS